MKRKKKVNIKKIVMIAACSLAGLVLLLLATAYLLVRSFIGKINYVDLEDEVIFTESDAVDSYIAPEADSPFSAAPVSAAVTKADSPTTEIDELDDSISRNMSENSTELIIQDKKVLNVLMIGTDTRRSDYRGLSDAMILISVNKETKKIIATSFLRDIYLGIPGQSKNNRLNAAYAYGGAKLLIETIEKSFRIKIDKYASVDFLSFIDIVDAVGGVTIGVSEEELHYVNNYIENINELIGEEADKDKLTSDGTQLLNGKQTLGYVRVRYVGTDFARTARQREVLEQIFLKLKKLKLSQYKSLLNTILPGITTNFKESEIFELILDLPDYLKYDTESLSIPIKGSYEDLRIRGMEVLGIDFEQNIQELMHRIYQSEQE